MLAPIDTDNATSQQEERRREETDTDLSYYKHNNYYSVELLITLGADPNHASENGAAPLIIACEKGSFYIAKVLLDAYGNPNVRSKWRDCFDEGMQLELG